MKKMLTLFFAVFATSSIIGAVTQVTTENFDKVVLKATKPVVIKFYATWCSACKAAEPRFKTFADNNKQYVCVAIDADRSKDLAQQYGINAYPTVVVIEQGKKVASFTGISSAEDLKTKVDKALASKKKSTTQAAAKPVAPTIEDQQTIMMVIQAVATNNTELLKTLIKEGANVNSVVQLPVPVGKDAGKQIEVTPLLLAFQLGNEEMAKLLLDAGADINQRCLNSKGKKVTARESLEELIRETTEQFSKTIQFIDAHQPKVA